MKSNLINIVCMLFCSFSVVSMSGCSQETKPVSTFTVMFDGNGGTLVSGNEVQKVSSASEIVPPTYARDGYTFDGWDKDYTVVSVDTLIKAQWTVAPAPVTTFTVTFNGNGGTLVSGSEVQNVKNASEIVPPTYTKDGYTFDGWDKDIQSIVSSTTVIALWRKISTDPITKYTKTLTMTGDSFKVLNLTDIQLCDSDSTDISKHVIDTLIERTQPDLITFLGDILNDDKDADSKINSKEVLEYIDSFNIPWAPVFGNHDTLDYGGAATSARTVGVDFLKDIFSECENCLYIEGPDEVLGDSNYIVDIVDSAGKHVESFIFFDSYTSGLQESHVTFYEQIVASLKARNNNVNVPTVLFDHIPLPQYSNAMENSKAIEYRDVVGCVYGHILSAGTEELFPKIKSLDSTKTVICGHDHENAYYTTYDGVKLAYAMKSSDGDDSNGVNFKHGLGGLVLTIDGKNEDKLDYEKVEDIGYTFGEGCEVTSYDFHPDVLPYWRYSGAKLKFDIELPDSGKIDFNIQGTNLFASSDQSTGAWNRLTNNATINATTKTIDYGSLTLLSGNKYSCEVDVTAYNLNTTDAVKSCGDETGRIVNFWHAEGKFTVSNLRYEFEEITETNQIDLANATIDNIEEQVSLKGKPVKPTPNVTLSGTTLKAVDDILLTYENNIEAGTATLKVVPSGKGAHRYKGSVSKTFTIVENTWRGELFEKGYQHSFDAKTIATDKLEFDVHFTSTGNNTMKFMIGDGWNSLFGYYGLKNDGTLEDNYNGITVKPLTDEYYRVTCVLKDLDKQNGETPLPTTTVNLFFIHKDWGNNPKGYIDFNVSPSPTVLRGEAFEVGANKSIPFTKLTYEDTIKVDFKFTSGADTKVNFFVGNSKGDWDYYFGYYAFFANGTLGDKYSGISVSTTSDGYYRLTIVLNQLTKASTAGGPSAEDGFNLFYIRGGWSNASGYVDFNPSDTPVEPKTKEFTMVDDDFVVANFTDIHVDSEDLLSDTGSVGKTIKYGINNSNPDILVFSGDIAGSSADLNNVCNYLDGFKIPYFFIMGNHDYQGSLGFDTILNRVNKSEYGYIEKGPDGLDSDGNYTINIKNTKGNLVHSLVMMDSGNKCAVSDPSKVEYVTNKISGVKYGSYNDNVTYCDSSGTSSWEGIRGEQINWYKNTVESLNCETTLISHMPFNEYVKAYEQYQDAINKDDKAKIAACEPIGKCTMGEQCCGPIENLGLFDAILEKGSTKNVICGHDHYNDFSLLYEGVRLTYALKTGEGAYWDESGKTSGYTTLTINSSGNATLNQIYYNPVS